MTLFKQRRHVNKLKYIYPLCVSMLALSLCGCQGDSPQALVTSAKAYLAKGEGQTAIIQLKNALQSDPNSAEARFLLGTVLLESGDARAAYVELSKAVELHHPAAQVLPRLAAAMNALGKFKELTDRYAKVDLGDAAANADLKTSVAVAYWQLGSLAQARSSIGEALQATPSYSPARLVQARLLAADRDFDGAAKLVERAIADNPGDAEAWKFSGDLAFFARSEPEQALQAYRSALKLKSGMASAHAGILMVLLSQKDFKAAEVELTQFKQAVPGNVEAKYYEATLALHREDIKTAKQLAQQLLAVAPDNSKLLYLAAITELKSNSLLRAEDYASKALQSLPGNVAMQKLAGQVYLRSGQPDKALSVLLPAVEAGSADAEILALVARAYFIGGDIKQAETYFSRAARLDPNDMSSRTALALAQLAKGNVAAGYDELQSIAAVDSGTTADVALISSLFQRKEFNKAVDAIERLKRKEPANPLPAVLTGRVQLAKSDLAGARSNFEQALKLSPQYFPAVAALANLDLREKKPEAARQRFDQLLSADPKNLQALLALVRLRVLAGAADEEIDGMLSRAIELNPAEAAPRMMLVERHMVKKSFKKALAVAQEGILAFPDQPALLEMLGQAQLASGDVNQALASFNRLVELTPHSQKPYLRLAETYVAMRQNDAAAQSLKRALLIDPKSMSARRGLISLKLAEGRTAESLAMARALQEQDSTDPAGFAAEGEIDVSLKDWNAAAAAYSAGLQKHKSTGLAVKLHTVLMAAGKQADADRFAASWRKDNPKDDAFLFYLADAQLGRKDFAAAERYYQAFLSLRPDSPVALNNLAWVTAKLNKPGAIDYAERANKLMPDQPAFMDTLAGLLDADGQTQKALLLQKKAVELAPTLPTFRFNLAKMLLKSGDKARAKAELETLSKLNEKFSDQAEVTRLLKVL